MRKDYLTIGEFANFMEVSVHQIRYFEEKEILFPAKVEKNGYRLYGMNEIYTLMYILFLRDLDIPVKRIKRLQEVNNVNSYIETMEKKSLEIDLEVKRLLAMKDKIENHVQFAKDNKMVDDNYRVESLEKYSLSLIETYSHEDRMTARKFVTMVETCQMEMEDIIYEIHDQSGVKICKQGEKGEETIKQGDYLTREILIDKEEDITKAISDFKEHANKENLHLKDEIIIIHDLRMTMFDAEQLLVKMMMKIGD